MKNTQLDALVTSLKNCESLENGLSKIRQDIGQSLIELKELETNYDITSPQQLTRLAQLQAVEKCHDTRIIGALERLNAAREELINALEIFTKDAFAPRYHELLKRAQEKVKAACTSKFHDAESAIESSPVINELRVLETYTIRGSRAIDEAQRKAGDIVEAWGKLDAFEKAHLK